MAGRIGSISPEQRALAVQRSLEARRNRKPAPVRDDFMDMGYWEDLASEFGVRLPIKGQKATTGKVTQFLKKIGIPVALFVEWMGCKTLKEAVSLNPTWSARAICGLAIEHRDQMLSLQKL